MANLKEAFEYAAQNPTSDFANNLKALAGSGSLDQEAKKYGIDLTPFKPKVEQTSQMSRLGTDLLNRAKTVGEQVKQVGQAEGVTETAAQVAQTPLRVVGQAAGAVGDIIGAGVNAATGGGLDKLGEYIASTETGKQLGSLLSKLQQEQPELAGTLGDLFNIATVGVGGAGAKPVVKAGVTGLERGAKATLKGATKTGQFLKEGISPTPTLGKALEEATVAKTAKEIPVFEKAISTIDTTDVKTFADLNKKFKEAIPTISKQVDDELLKDTTVYKIEDLLIPQVTKSGKEIKTDYITRALDGLDDLYTKLGDDVSKADIQDLKAKAQTQGLTRLDVNNLARQYNIEYGNKAFTATGDIKQGFNADVYESTRKGLKDIARSGLGGEQAKALDESLSAIYDAQRLAERNANAVQAMKTRIEEKGWVGKGIRGAFDISDLLTGGAVRALRDTVLARGNAQKLQNVLELENKLKKNLEVINKAMKAPTEAKAVEILNTLPKEKGVIGTAIDNLKDPKMRQGGYIANPLAKKELPVQKSSSVNNTTDLVSEAKKYKSAEDFVKAQGDTVYHGTDSNSFDLQNFDPTKAAKGESFFNPLGKGLYTSSNKDFVKRFGKNVEEIVIPKNAKVKKVSIENWKKDFPIISRKSLKNLGIKYDDLTFDEKLKINRLVPDTPIEVSNNFEELLRDIAERLNKKGSIQDAIQKATMDKYKDFDIIRYLDTDYAFDADEIVIKNPAILKTKSQLEDIWKQAQGKLPKKQK